MVRTITKRPKDSDDDEHEPSSGNESSSESDSQKKPEKKQKKHKKHKAKERRQETDDESADERTIPPKRSLAQTVVEQSMSRSDDEQSVPSSQPSQPSSQPRPRVTVAGKSPRLTKKHEYRIGTASKFAFEDIESIEAFSGAVSYNVNPNKSDSRKYYILFKEHNGLKDGAWYFGRKIEQYVAEHEEKHPKRCKFFTHFWNKPSVEQWVIKKDQPELCDIFELRKDNNTQRYLDTVKHPFPESKRNAPAKRKRTVSPPSEPKSSTSYSSSSPSSSSSSPEPVHETRPDTQMFKNVLDTMLLMQEKFLGTTTEILREQKNFVQAMTTQTSQQVHSVLNGVTHLTNMVHSMLSRQQPNHEPDLLLPQQPLAPLCFQERVPLTICEAIMSTSPSTSSSSATTSSTSSSSVTTSSTSSSSSTTIPISSTTSSHKSPERSPVPETVQHSPVQIEFNRLIVEKNNQQERLLSQTTQESQNATCSQELMLDYENSEVVTDPADLAYDESIFDTIH